MSLRTYSLITHPKYLRHVERKLFGESGLPVSEDFAIPRIDKIQDIAEYLKISPNTIRFALINAPKYYRYFALPKKSGGARLIASPRLFLKVIQWWIKDVILDYLPCDQSSHGFVKGRSFITNARSHIGARHVLNVDIKKCFDNVDTKMLEPVFIGAGYNSAVSLQLYALCSLNGSLPQGAPTSPSLLNQVLRQVDAKLRTTVGQEGVVYTRYADDLTFSSSNWIDLSVLEAVKSELANVGLVLNEQKTRFMGENDRKIVTGLVLGDGRVNLPKSYLNSSWMDRKTRKVG